MQIDTAAAIDLSKEKKQNESSFSDQMKAYICLLYTSPSPRD